MAALQRSPSLTKKTMLCRHCASELKGRADGVLFCAECAAAAKSELVKQTAQHVEDATCYNCKKTFKLKTVAEHDGFCGRCSKGEARAMEDEKAAIEHQLARVVWLHYYGIESSIKQRCYCCGVQEISVFSFQCGHVVAQARGGPTHVANLRPICAPCNQGMGTEDMREFARRHGFMSKLNGEAGASGSRPEPFEMVPGPSQVPDDVNGCRPGCSVM